MFAVLLIALASILSLIERLRFFITLVHTVLTWQANMIRKTTRVFDVSKGLSMKDLSAIFPVHWTFVKTKTASTHYTSARCPDKAA